MVRELRTPKYQQQRVPSGRLEDEEERRWRRYKEIEFDEKEED